MSRHGLVVLLLAAAAFGMPAPVHAGSDDPTERAIRDAAYRVYEAELLELAQTDSLDNDPEAYELVHRVYSRLQATAKIWFPRTVEWDWEIHVSARLESAWSAPGCKLMVGSALVRELAGDEAALAFVLGHEIAHCVLEHTRALMDAAVDGDLRLARLQTRDLLWMIDGDIRQVLRLAPVSRVLEDDADRVGMVLAAAAGYDPGRMSAYFKLADEAAGPLAATHAANAKRIAALDAMLPVARQVYAAYRL